MMLEASLPPSTMTHTSLSPSDFVAEFWKYVSKLMAQVSQFLDFIGQFVGLMFWAVTRTDK